MKNLLLTCVLTLGSAFSAFAQGTIIFANDASTLVTTNDLQGHVGAATSANGTRVVLYYSTFPFSPSPPVINPEYNFGWASSLPIAADLAGTPTAGLFSGGTRTLDQVGGGDMVWVVARGWTGGYSDWPSAYAAASGPGGSSIFVGTTTAWLQPTGNGGFPPFTTPAVPITLGPDGFKGLVLSPLVPEPSTFALIGLAGTAIFFGRRHMVRK